MATKKKTARKGSKKPAARPAAQKSKGKKAVGRKAAGKKRAAPIPIKTTTVIYVDSCAFFPLESSSGWLDGAQEGRCTTTPRHSLLAPLPLPVKATIHSITVYYMNTTQEYMQASILRKSIDHHCNTDEYAVSLEALPPATLPPDNFVAKVIDHFADGGVVMDKYLYFIEVGNTINDGLAGVRKVRGMRIEYSLPTVK
jgi:hypothetical protein